jgi:hypothetical protein
LKVCMKMQNEEMNVNLISTVHVLTLNVLLSLIL